MTIRCDININSNEITSIYIKILPFVIITNYNILVCYYIYPNYN